MTARKYPPICSFPGCGRPHNSRGLCNPHGVMQRAGRPLRPVQARTGPVERPAAERFAEKVEVQADGCHVWVGGLYLNGYGQFGPGGSEKTPAHRWSYEHHVGPIPDGLDLDHLCRNRACVNPEHLEPVTRAENIRRAAALKTSCPAGHPYTPENTYVRPGLGHRKCRTCMRKRDRNRKRRTTSRKAA